MTDLVVHQKALPNCDHGTDEIATDRIICNRQSADDAYEMLLGRGVRWFPKAFAAE
jgi:hypothetical protein